MGRLIFNFRLTWSSVTDGRAARTDHGAAARDSTRKTEDEQPSTDLHEQLVAEHAPAVGVGAQLQPRHRARRQHAARRPRAQRQPRRADARRPRVCTPAAPAERTDTVYRRKGRERKRVRNIRGSGKGGSWSSPRTRVRARCSGKRRTRALQRAVSADTLRTTTTRDRTAHTDTVRGGRPAHAPDERARRAPPVRSGRRQNCRQQRSPSAGGCGADARQQRHTRVSGGGDRTARGDR